VASVADKPDFHQKLSHAESVSIGAKDPIVAAQDVLNLTRMNWNTAKIRGKWPVSLSFARRVGILDEYGEDDLAETSFRYFV
jgi:hypothetical protein